MTGAKLKRYREQFGLTLNELAEAADLSVSYVSEVERGLKNPSLKTLKKIAAALRLPVGLLLGEPHASPGDALPLGDKIRELRLKLGLTQAALAEKVAVTPGLIGQIESGATFPSTKLLEAIALALGLSSPCYLVIDGEESLQLFASLTPAVREALRNANVQEVILSICTLPEKDIRFILEMIRLYKKTFSA